MKFLWRVLGWDKKDYTALTDKQHESIKQVSSADITVGFDMLKAKMENDGVPEIWIALAAESYRRKSLEHLVLTQCLPNMRNGKK